MCGRITVNEKTPDKGLLYFVKDVDADADVHILSRKAVAEMQLPVYRIRP